MGAADVRARTAREMRGMIRRRFGRTTDAVLVPEHTVAFEVPIDGVPRFPGFAGLEDYRKRQRLDAVALGLWGQCKHRLHGFEVKVSRADLLAELRDPDKAAAGVAACSTWALVLGDPRLLRDGDDLPPGWGMYAPHGRGLREFVAPADRGPVDIAPRLAAALMQSALREPRYAYSMGHSDGRHQERARWERRQRESQAAS